MNLENIQLTTECLKATSHIGGTTWHNVCNGAVNYVPWGMGDWILASLGLGLTIMFVAIFANLIKLIFTS